MQVTSSIQTGSRYLRPNGSGDTYDKFQGWGLAGSGAGTFEDSFTESQTEQVKANYEASKRIKRMMSNSRTRNVKVGPTAEQTTEQTTRETFRGVTLFNRWRLGKYTVTETSKQVTLYDVSAEIMNGAGQMKTQISETLPQLPKLKTGWYVFD